MSDPDDFLNGPNAAEDDDVIVDALPAEKSFRHKAGQYPGVLSKVEKDISKRSGSRMVVFSFYLADLKTTMKRWVSLADNAIWGLTEVTKAIGAGKEGDRILMSHLRAAVGAPVIVEVGDSEYNGKPTSEIVKLTADPSREKLQVGDDGLPF